MNSRQKLYKYVIEKFSIDDYELFWDRDHEGHFRHDFPTFEKFQLQQKVEIFQLSEDELAFALQLMKCIPDSFIRIIDKDKSNLEWSTDGFFFWGRQLIMTIPK